MEKQLVSELNITWAQAHDLVLHAKGQLGIGPHDTVSREQEDEINRIAKETQAKNPVPPPAKMNRKTESERKRAKHAAEMEENMENAGKCAALCLICCCCLGNN